MKVCFSPKEIPAGWFLADCAVSGGTLEAYLQQVLQASDGRLCVRLRPVYMDFCLPCLTGIGTELTADQLRQIHDSQTGYFSPSLCTEYFTCIKDDAAHVVLYDSMQSLQAKYAALERCCIPMVLIEDKKLRDTLCGDLRN